MKKTFAQEPSAGNQPTFFHKSQKYALPAKNPAKTEHNQLKTIFLQKTPIDISDQIDYN